MIKKRGSQRATDIKFLLPSVNPFIIRIISIYGSQMLAGIPFDIEPHYSRSIIKHGALILSTFGASFFDVLPV